MAKTDKPNILVIWGDDIGISNLSCYSRGVMEFAATFTPAQRPGSFTIDEALSKMREPTAN